MAPQSIMLIMRHISDSRRDKLGIYKRLQIHFCLGLLPFFVWIFVSSRQHKRAFIAVRLNKGIDPEAAEQDYNKEYESS
jgi:hypothetical protein